MNKAQSLLENDPASKMLGISIESMADGRVNLKMLVRSDMTNGYQVCHGGFIFTLADTACAFAAAESGDRILTASNQIDYLAAARLGDTLLAKAQLSFSTGKNRFCDVKVCDQNNQVIAVMHSRLVSK